MLKQLANALTLLRLVLAPVVAWALWQAFVLAPPVPIPGDLTNGETWALVCAGLFILAALTDLFDGMAARAFNGESKFGRIIDPIADKLLVGLPLIVMALVALDAGPTMGLLVAIPVAVIVARDALITVLRLSSKDGEGARVSLLAKWKTTLELLVVGAPILALAAGPTIKLLAVGDGFVTPTVAIFGWLAALIAAALLSAFTALQYLLAKPATA